MKTSTIAALAAINRRFYRDHAVAFDRTRDRGWGGWETVIDHLVPALDRAAAVAEVAAAGTVSPAGTVATPPRILDLGCGNGRFAVFLEESLRERGSSRSGSKPTFGVLGVDESEELLGVARERCAHLGNRCGFQRLDLLSWLGGETKPWFPGTLAAAVAFGLTHHIPSFALRRQLLARSLDSVVDRGLVACSFWQLVDDPGFERRRASWIEHPAAFGVDLDDLEVDDHLLTFGNAAGVAGDAPARYCHHSAEAEIERLIAGLPAVEVARYFGPGGADRCNLYLILERSPR